MDKACQNEECLECGGRGCCMEESCLCCPPPLEFQDCSLLTGAPTGGFMSLQSKRANYQGSLCSTPDFQQSSSALVRMNPMMQAAFGIYPPLNEFFQKVNPALGENSNCKVGMNPYMCAVVQQAEAAQNNDVFQYAMSSEAQFSSGTSVRFQNSSPFPASTVKSSRAVTSKSNLTSASAQSRRSSSKRRREPAQYVENDSDDDGKDGVEYTECCYPPYQQQQPYEEMQAPTYCQCPECQNVPCPAPYPGSPQGEAPIYCQYPEWTNMQCSGPCPPYVEGQPGLQNLQQECCYQPPQEGPQYYVDNACCQEQEPQNCCPLPECTWSCPQPMQDCCQPERMQACYCPPQSVQNYCCAPTSCCCPSCNCGNPCCPSVSNCLGTLLNNNNSCCCNPCMPCSCCCGNNCCGCGMDSCCKPWCGVGTGCGCKDCSQKQGPPGWSVSGWEIKNFSNCLMGYVCTFQMRKKRTVLKNNVVQEISYESPESKSEIKNNPSEEVGRDGNEDERSNYSNYQEQNGGEDDDSGNDRMRRAVSEPVFKGTQTPGSKSSNKTVSSGKKSRFCKFF